MNMFRRDLSQNSNVDERSASRLRLSTLGRFTSKAGGGRFLPILLTVIIPTIVAGFYFYGLAADQYMSEARFVVRGVAPQASGAWSSLLQTAGLSRTQDDTYAVQDFILSRDALRELIENQDLRAVFSRPEADLISRFPTIFGGDTFEQLYKYYLNHIDVEMDSTTGVSELTVKAFRAHDAQNLATALLAASERLVNRMNARERENALGDARSEVAVAERRIREASMQISDFQNREALLDPNKQSVSMLGTVVSMQARLMSVQLEVSQLRSASPDSPLLKGAVQRANAIQVEIEAAKRQITGPDTSLVPKIRHFDSLLLEREFAEKQLSSATVSLEVARTNANRQQLYLAQIVQPNEPDYANFPRRLSGIAVVFATFFGLYVMGSLLVAGAREHKFI